MADIDTATAKAQLIEALRTSGAETLRRLRALPPEQLEEGRYENGWNGRQILAHIASIEWTYPRLIDIAAAANAPAGASAPKSTETTAEGRPTKTARGGIINYNERQVEKRAEAGVAELLNEFERNRAATIAAVEAVDEALFAHEITSAGGITGTLDQVLNAVAVLHIIGHANDIVGQQ